MNARPVPVYPGLVIDDLHLVLPERLKLSRTYRAESTPDVSGVSSVMVPHLTFVLVMLLMCCVSTTIHVFSDMSYKPFVLPLTPLKLYSGGVFVVGRGEGGCRGWRSIGGGIGGGIDGLKDIYAKLTKLMLSMVMSKHKNRRQRPQSTPENLLMIKYGASKWLLLEITLPYNQMLCQRSSNVPDAMNQPPPHSRIFTTMGAYMFARTSAHISPSLKSCAHPPVPEMM